MTLQTLDSARIVQHKFLIIQTELLEQFFLRGLIRVEVQTVQGL